VKAQRSRAGSLLTDRNSDRPGEIPGDVLVLGKTK